MSAPTCKDVNLYWRTTFGFGKDHWLPCYPNLHEWSHRRWRLALVAPVHKASLDIIQVDGGVLRLLLHKLFYASVKDSTAEMRLYVQVRRECNHVKTLSERTFLGINANATLLNLSPTVTTWRKLPTKRHIWDTKLYTLIWLSDRRWTVWTIFSL